MSEIKDVTYAQVLEVLGQTLVDHASVSVPSDADTLAINSLRNNTSILKDIQITTYTYRPLIGMLTSTSPSGVTTYYDYDLCDRLEETYIYKNNIVSTDNKQIIQSYDYHYQNAIRATMKKHIVTILSVFVTLIVLQQENHYLKTTQL